MFIIFALFILTARVSCNTTYYIPPLQWPCIAPDSDGCYSCGTYSFWVKYIGGVNNNNLVSIQNIKCICATAQGGSTRDPYGYTNFNGNVYYKTFDCEELICETGYVADYTNRVCVCGPGYYSNANTCTPCPLGTYNSETKKLHVHCAMQTHTQTKPH
jgi:hypothetical protein